MHSYNKRFREIVIAHPPESIQSRDQLASNSQNQDPHKLGSTPSPTQNRIQDMYSVGCFWEDRSTVASGRQWPEFAKSVTWRNGLKTVAPYVGIPLNLKDADVGVHQENPP
ncbi:hypothetical protein BV25DRAFT_1843562 [Artomyces pyxidatus]|uniref:Uncharacterized protein n=1 Tax=Artomyces pyxidatus TaxID=48021 RepID=A0ACB8SF99_9AGAM|nr:hypothetical protein BV25DRAFT_1843562 [Artomyces pyxidatus]